MPPIARRGWIVLAFGFVVALAPLAWAPLVMQDPPEFGLSGVLFYGWSALPFFVLAVLDRGLKMSFASFVVAAVLVTAATVALQIGVLLYSSGSTDAIAFLFLPLWLSVAVGAVAGMDKVARAAVGRRG